MSHRQNSVEIARAENSRPRVDARSGNNSAAGVLPKTLQFPVYREAPRVEQHDQRRPEDHGQNGSECNHPFDWSARLFTSPRLLPTGMLGEIKRNPRRYLRFRLRDRQLEIEFAALIDD